MSTVHASLLALCLSTAGMGALAFAMDRHYAQLTAKDDIPVVYRSWLRVTGVLLLLAVSLPAIWGWSVTVGIVMVLAFWSMGALLAVAGIACSARWFAVLAMGMALVGIGCLLRAGIG